MCNMREWLRIVGRGEKMAQSTSEFQHTNWRIARFDSPLMTTDNFHGIDRLVGIASPIRSILSRRCAIRRPICANCGTGLAIWDLRRQPTMQVQAE